MSRLLAMALVVGVLGIAISCGVDTPESVAEPGVGDIAPTEAANIQVIPVDPTDGGLRAHLATKVLDVGKQRIAFLLVTEKALVKAPYAEISVAHADGAAPADSGYGQFQRMALWRAWIVLRCHRLPDRRQLSADGIRR